MLIPEEQILQFTFASELAELPTDELMHQFDGDLLPIVTQFNCLNYWVPLLNRFDKILEEIIDKYKFEEFVEVKLVVVDDVDEKKIITILKFTETLLNLCSSKSLYNSSERLYQLLNSPKETIWYQVLRVLVGIAGRVVNKRYIPMKIPTSVRKRVHHIANNFPPTIQILDENNLRDNHSLLDIVAHNKPVPEDWKRLEFQYFKSTPQLKVAKPAKKKVPAKLQEGITKLTFSKQEISKLSYQELYDKVTEILPSDYWFNFGVQLNIVKSFNSSNDECLMLRQRLVQLTILAAAYNILITDTYSDGKTSPLLSDKELHSIKEIINLIKPENQESFENVVYCDAMFAIASISCKKYLRSELLKLLNGNVSHGLIFKILRTISKVLEKNNTMISVKELSLKDDRAEIMRKSCTYFFQFLENIVEVKSLSNSLISAGLLTQLVEILPFRSNKYKTIIGYSAYILKVMITRNLSNLDPFIANGGFKVLIESIGYQVDYFIKNQNLFIGLDNLKKDTKNFNASELYETDLGVRILMKVKEINYTKSLVTMTLGLIRTDSGDRMRNLFDSPILQSFNLIFKNSNLFGANVLTDSLNTISSIIQNEPTSFPILLESKTIDTIISNFSKFLIDDPLLILCLPDLIGAICLNKTGLKTVLDDKIITQFFKIFYNKDIAKTLIDVELTSSVALAFDDLARHYAELKPEILEATEKLIVDIPELVSGKMQGIQFYKSRQGNRNLYYSESEPDDYSEKDCQTLAEDPETEINIILCVSAFLCTALTEYNTWRPLLEITEEDTSKFDSWLSLLLFEKSPTETVNSSFNLLLSCLRTIDSPTLGYGFKSLFERVMELITDPLIINFIEYEGPKSFFYQFDNDDFEDQSASIFLQKLNLFNLSVNALNDMYVRVATNFNQLSKHLGHKDNLKFLSLSAKLYKRLAIEEILIRENLPLGPAEYIEPIGREDLYTPPIVVKSENINKSKETIRKTSPKIKNTLQIRSIMEEIQSAIGDCYSFIPDLQLEKCKENAIINEYFVQTIVKELLDYSKLSLTDLQLKNYLLVVVDLIEHILVVNAAGTIKVKTVFAVLFLQHNGFDILKQILFDIWSKLEVTDESKKYYKYIDYYLITQNDYCISMALAFKILKQFQHIVTRKSINTNPPKYDFSSKVYKGSIGKAFLIQARRFIFVQLMELFDLPAFHREAVLPLYVVKELVAISSEVFCGEGEKLNKNEDENLYPLTYENFNKKEAFKEYLGRFGLNSAEIELIDNQGLLDDSSELFDTVPEGINEVKWAKIQSDVEDDKFVELPEPLILFPELESTVALKEFRSVYCDLMVLTWLNLCQLYPGTEESIANFFNGIFKFRFSSEENDEWFYPLEAAVDVLLSFELDYSKGPECQELASVLKLVGYLLNEGASYDINRRNLSELLNFLSSVINLNCTKTNWFGHALIVYEAIYSTSLLYHEESAIEMPDIADTQSRLPYDIPEEVSEKILDTIINIDDFVDVKTPMSVALILVIYLQNYDYDRVTSSSILIKLMKVVKNFDVLYLRFNEPPVGSDDNMAVSTMKQKFEYTRKKVFNKYQSLLTALIRRCFETKEIVTELLVRAVDANVANGENKFRTRRIKGNLLEIVKHDSSYVLRDRGLFLSTISKKVMLDSPQNPLLSYLIVKDENQDTDPVKESDEKITTTGNVSRIMRSLLMELMSFKNYDWANDTPEQIRKLEDAKKAKRSVRDEINKSYNSPEFDYIVYLLRVITELLVSYKQSKFDFLTFSKKGLGVKPHSTALNFFLHLLIPTNVFVSNKSNEYRRRLLVSKRAKTALCALLVGTKLDLKVKPSKIPQKEDSDMLFIRTFSIGIISKALRETSESSEPVNSRLSKLVDLTDLCSLFMNADLPNEIFKECLLSFDNYYIGRSMLEKNIPSQLASIVTDIDLNFPGIKKVAKSVTRLLNLFGALKADHQDLFKGSSDGEEEEEVEGEDYESQDEISQMVRNSSLAINDIDNNSSQDDEDEDSEDYEDDDIIVYSDEIDEVMEDDEDESGDEEDDQGSIMEIDVDVDVDDENLYDQEVFSDEESEEADNENEIDDDIEIFNEMLDDVSDSDHYFSHGQAEEVIDDDGEDHDEDEDDDDDEGNVDDDDEEDLSSEADSDVIDHWVENYEELHGGSRNPLAAGRSRPVGRLNPPGDMTVLSFIRSFAGWEGREREPRVRRRDTNNGLQFYYDFNGEGTENFEHLHQDEDEEVPFNEDEEEEEEEEEEDPHFPRGRADGVSRIIRSMIPRRLNSRGDDMGGWFNGGRRMFGFESMFNSRMPNRRGSIFHEFRTTEETWQDLYMGHLHKSTLMEASRIMPLIVDAIYDKSKVHAEKLKEKERLRKQEADAKRKLEEEERKKEQEEEERKKQEELEAREDAGSVEQEVVVEPVLVQIGDREVDISGTDIDLEFLLALPMEIREEVYMQHETERRAQENRTANSTAPGGIDPEFLNALPEQLRHEVLAEEALATRFSLENFNSEGEDNEIFEHEHHRHTEEENEEEQPGKGKDSSKKKIYFTPLVERTEVIGLLRLIFISQKSVQEDEFYDLLEYLCYNKQTRSETVSILLLILQDGINDQKSLEKVFIRLSSKALKQAAGQPLKCAAQFPISATPAEVASRILGALNYLLESYPHLRYYFLTEHDSSMLSRKLIRPKSKLKELTKKESKYPINILLTLIEKPLVKKEQLLMDLLSKGIKIATSSLAVLAIIGKSKKEEKKDADTSATISEIPVEGSSGTDASVEAIKESDDAIPVDEKVVSLKSDKPIKELEPPIIPNSNLSMVVSILISDDCSNKTFQQTLTTMKNLSSIPNAKQVFSSQLSAFATDAGKLLVNDLKDLADCIEAASETSDVSSEIFNRFTKSSSTQNKLLRVLTAVDYLFDSKKEEIDFESLKTLYENLALGELWGKLSDCLRGLEKRKSLYHVAAVLLPLIESLMVVCKHSKVKDLQAKDTLKYENKAHDFTNEPIESLFFSFTNEHKVILNEMVRTKPKLMSGPFAMLVRNPKILEFDNKRNYFDRKLHSKSLASASLSVKVSRDKVFLDSFKALAFKQANVFRDSPLDISFKGEAGIDAGGVTREWYQVLSRQMFNPDYALFIPVASDKSTFHPNRTSWVNSDHLLFFKFIGRVIGKGIYDNQYLDAHFSRAVYKRLLGVAVSLKDMETLDLDYFKSLMWMLENDITDIITETFSMDTDDYGEQKVVDLISNGRNIMVSEENKHEYVKRVVEYRLQESVKEQMESFLQGFHEIIPKELISIFDEQELELLISGLPDIDVDDWKQNTNYTNYSPSSPEIQWFWRAVKSFENEQKAKLLQFVTGTSKVPLQGFSSLAGVNGNQKFSIHRDYGSPDRLPSAHTCFNQLDLPGYQTYEQLRGSLLLAITEGHEGFGFA